MCGLQLLVRNAQSQLPPQRLLNQSLHFNKIPHMICTHNTLWGTLSWDPRSAFAGNPINPSNDCRGRVHWPRSWSIQSHPINLCPSKKTAELTSSDGAMPNVIIPKWEADGVCEGPSKSISKRESLALIKFATYWGQKRGRPWSQIARWVTGWGNVFWLGTSE